MEEERDGDLEDLLLAARERARRRAAPGPEEGEALHHRLDVPPYPGIAARVGPHLQVLLDAHRGKVAAALGDVGAAAAEHVHRVLAVEAEQRLARALAVQSRPRELEVRDAGKAIDFATREPRKAPVSSTTRGIEQPSSPSCLSDRGGVALL
jgi:hypothetical protein